LVCCDFRVSEASGVRLLGLHPSTSHRICEHSSLQGELLPLVFRFHFWLSVCRSAIGQRAFV